MNEDNKKINIHVMSDLHLDMLPDPEVYKFFSKLKPYAKDIDTVVLAGDISNIREKSVFAGTLDLFTEVYKNIIYVPGNHDYYDTNFDTAYEILSEVSNEIKGLHVLGGPNHNTITIDNVDYVGGTLWFSEPPKTLRKSLFPDFRFIYDFEPEVYNLNKYFKEQVISNEVKKGCVVITHHFPFHQSIHSDFANNIWNHFFYSDCSSLIHEGNAPKLWIHGHTHYPFDYKLPNIDTRVYCNPLGYKLEGCNPFFFDKLTVTL
jgi:predicted phosphodiesterase